MVRGLNQETIRRATAKMIIINELSFSHVKNFRFRHFCSVAYPRFVMLHLVEPLLRISLTYF